MSEPESSSPATEASTSTWESVVGLVETLRPHQWIKNLFVLAPLFFSREFVHPGPLLLGLTAGLLFCLAAGTVYLVNDIMDVEKDRQHPVKKHRPIPSGRLPVRIAVVAAVVLGFGTVGASAAISPWMGAVVGGYIVMNLAYSTVLKRIPFVDVSVIAVGFVLRVLAGKFAVDVYVSEWLIGCTFLVALYLALGKRTHELEEHAADGSSKARSVLERYRYEQLDFALLYVGGITIVGYTLYTVTAALPNLAPSLTVRPFREEPTPFSSRYLPTTVLFVVFGIVRFYKIVHSDEPRSPTELIVRDRLFVVNLALWGLAMLYFAFA